MIMITTTVLTVLRNINLWRWRWETRVETSKYLAGELAAALH